MIARVPLTADAIVTGQSPWVGMWEWYHYHSSRSDSGFSQNGPCKAIITFKINYLCLEAAFSVWWLKLMPALMQLTGIGLHKTEHKKSHVEQILTVGIQWSCILSCFMARLPLHVTSMGWCRLCVIRNQTISVLLFSCFGGGGHPVSTACTFMLALPLNIVCLVC